MTRMNRHFNAVGKKMAGEKENTRALQHNSANRNYTDSSAGLIFELQRSIGNRAVRRYLSGVVLRDAKEDEGASGSGTRPAQSTGVQSSNHRVKRVILKAGEVATIMRADIMDLAQKAKDLIAKGPNQAHISIAYINSGGSVRFLGPNEPCVDDRRLSQISQALESLGVPAAFKGIVYPPVNLDCPKAGIAIDLYDDINLSVNDDYITAAPAALSMQKPSAAPAGSSPSLSDMLKFILYKNDKLIVDVEIPKSLTAKIPVTIGRSKSLTFTLKAETSGTFSFSMTIDNVVPYFSVRIESGVTIDKDKGTSGAVGIVFDSARRSYRADNPELLKASIVAAGGKLTNAYNELMAATSNEERIEKLPDIAGAIGDMYEAIEKSKAAAKPVPEFSLRFGAQGVLVPGPKTYDDPDPLKRPAPSLGGSFQWNWDLF